MSEVDPYIKNETTTRTIRIDKGYDEVIKQEAQKNSVTINTLMEQIVRKYVLSYRFFENLGTISFSLQSMNAILELMDSTELIEVARVIGKDRPIELLAKRGLDVSYDSAIWYISNLAENSGWFKSNYHENQGTGVLHLSHPFGKKWSLFLEAYYISFFSELVGVIPRSESFSGAVSFTIQIPKHQKTKE